MSTWVRLVEMFTSPVTITLTRDEAEQAFYSLAASDSAIHQRIAEKIQTAMEEQGRAQVNALGGKS